MPNIFHGCLQQDTSSTNRTKSAQSEYSFFRVVFWHPALELIWVLACLVLFVFSSYLWQLFFSPFPFFLVFFFFNHQQEQTIESKISFWVLWGLMLPRQPNLTVLNWSPWSLPFITQSISINWSEGWHMLTCQNVNCSNILKMHYRSSS